MTNMVYILGFVEGLFRKLFVQLDRVAFGFIDDAYNLIDTFAKAELVSDDLVKTITINMYVIVGIFALFRMALLLVNSILDPDKLTEKGAGVTKVFFNFLLVFVFLIATPIAFNIGFDIQKKVVEENYMQRLFINVDKLEGQTPGDNLRNIAIGSLLTIDDYVVTNGVTNDKCDSDCGDAVNAYNDMVDGTHKDSKGKTGFDFSLISKHIATEVDGENGEEIFVYNYPIIISTVVGGFVTYVLLSFALDIAVRLIELAVLEILAPLFIITYIDPKSSKSGPFSKWLKTVGKTYVSLFIKLGVLGIMFLLISVITKAQANNDDLKGFAGLVLIIAILIFAKKAPKWLGGMFGVEGGIGGLSIGKKIKDEMLGGGALSKAAHKAGLLGAGVAMGAAKTAHARHKAVKANLNKEQRRAKNRLADSYRKNIEENGGRRFDSAKKAVKESLFTKDAIKQNAKNWADTRKAGMSGVAQGAMTGFDAGKASGTLKDLNIKTKKDARNDLKEMSPSYKTIGERLSESAQGRVENWTNNAMGDGFKRGQRAKDVADRAEALLIYGKAVEPGSESGKYPIEAKQMIDFKSTNDVFEYIAKQKGSVPSGIKYTGTFDKKTGDREFTYIGADGKESGPITMRKYCEDNGFVTPYGSQKIATEMKQVAQQNITKFNHNQEMQVNGRQQIAESVTRINDLTSALKSNIIPTTLQLDFNNCKGNFDAVKTKIQADIKGSEESMYKVMFDLNEKKSEKEKLEKSEKPDKYRIYELTKEIEGLNIDIVNIGKEIDAKKEQLNSTIPGVEALMKSVNKIDSNFTDISRLETALLNETDENKRNAMQSTIITLTTMIEKIKGDIAANPNANNNVISNIDALIAANQTKNSAVKTVEVLNVENQTIANEIRQNQELYTTKDTITGEEIKFNPNSTNNEQFIREFQKVINKDLDRVQKLKPKTDEKK